MASACSPSGRPSSAATSSTASIRSAEPGVAFTTTSEGGRMPAVLHCVLSAVTEGHSCRASGGQPQGSPPSPVASSAVSPIRVGATRPIASHRSSHQKWSYPGRSVRPPDCHGPQHPSKHGQNRKPCVHCAADVRIRKPQRHLDLGFATEALTFALRRCLVPRTMAAFDARLASAGRAMTGWNSSIMDPIARHTIGIPKRTDPLGPSVSPHPRN
jgi:hypothetical protein